jgi:hypothetical protein
MTTLPSKEGDVQWRSHLLEIGLVSDGEKREKQRKSKHTKKPIKKNLILIQKYKKYKINKKFSIEAEQIIFKTNSSY